MKKVVILAMENSVLSTIASPMDMLLQAGVLWNITMGEQPQPLFDVKIVAADGHASQEELQLLEVLSYDLEIDPLAAAAIQRGARARHTSL